MTNSDLERLTLENRRLLSVIRKQEGQIKEKDLCIYKRNMTIADTESEYLETLRRWEEEDQKGEVDELISRSIINVYKSVLSILRKNK